MAQDIIKQAEEYCATQKRRLTEPRLIVLKILASSSKPLGAYDVLEQLKEFISKPKPATVYRAIEFWQEIGFIHRIESLNAYVVCAADHQHDGSQFMICDACNKVIETHLCSLPEPIKKTTHRQSFTPSRWNLEIFGLCAECV